MSKAQDNVTQLNDNTYVKQQYRDSSNLDARIALHQRFSVNQYGWQCWVFDQLRLSEGVRILELGCGPGSLWQANADRLTPQVRMTLTDYSAGMLAQARTRLQGVVHAAYRVVDAQNIPYPNR